MAHLGSGWRAGDRSSKWIGGQVWPAPERSVVLASFFRNIPFVPRPRPWGAVPLFLSLGVSAVDSIHCLDKKKTSLLHASLLTLSEKDLNIECWPSVPTGGGADEPREV